MTKKLLWIVAVLAVPLCAFFACVLMSIWPSYIRVPRLNIPESELVGITRYRAAQEDRDFYVEDARYLVPQSAFGSAEELMAIVEETLSPNDWVENQSLSEPAAERCDLIEGDLAAPENTRVYVTVGYVATSADNRLAAPQLCIMIKPNQAALQYEVILATLRPSAISAPSD